VNERRRDWPTTPPAEQAGAPGRPPGRPQLVSDRVQLTDGATVTVHVGKVELGQGIATALAQIAADALGVGFGRIRMAEVVTGSSPNEGFTAGSRSVMDSGDALARACAQARAALLGEAAARLGAAGGLTVHDGVVRAADGERCWDFWTLDRPGLLDVPLEVSTAAQPPVSRGVVGANIPRLDLPAKLTGEAAFVHDLRFPGQLHGRIVRPPGPGARLTGVDPAAAGDGAFAVVRDGSFLGVIAEREEEAIRAARLLSAAASWSAGPALPDEDGMAEILRATVSEDSVVEHRTDQAATARVTRTLRVRFTRPYLAHASIGPGCAVAVWADAGVHVWTHSQGIYPLRSAIASVCGLAEDAVVVHHSAGAGCYGHNSADDVALDAVLLARAVPGRPVAVVWSRDDEFAWEPYGPPMLAEVEVGVDAAFQVQSWRQDVYSYGHQSRPGYAGNHGLLAGWHAAEVTELPPASDPPPAGGGGTSRNALPGYDFPALEVTAHRLLEMPLRTSSLRALGAMLNVFAIECTIDELAQLAGEDPVGYRLRHLSDPRSRAVLQAAADRAGWPERPAGVDRGTGTADRGTGIAFARYKNSCAYCAVVAEVEAGASLQVRRLVLAVDAGCVVNPDGLINQIEGGAVQATSWTLLERVRFDHSRITSRDWESYPILRFSQVPTVEVALIDQPALPSLGVGECAQGPVAAAIANALADAIGLRVRDLPLTPERIVAAMESG
jgi:nicotinate dehydrogenase subunit B